jgi:hypothetical protein
MDTGVDGYEFAIADDMGTNARPKPMAKDLRSDAFMRVILFI